MPFLFEWDAVGGAECWRQSEAEQQEEFAPPQARSRRADVDVEQFSKRTIAFLNLAILIHSEGWRAETFLQMIKASQEPVFIEELVGDLLTKRNANLLQEIEAEFPGSEVIVVPWGAAHMRGIAEGIQKSGFHLADSQEHMIFHFRSVWNRPLYPNKKRAAAPPGKGRNLHRKQPETICPGTLTASAGGRSDRDNSSTAGR